MNINTLHSILTQLSDSEKRYRDGKVYSGWTNIPMDTVNGREVQRLDFDSDNYNAGNISLSDVCSFRKQLIVKKNSRFNPVPEHVHSHLELNYVYSGTCPQTIHGKEILLKPNQVLLIDVDCPHSIGSLGENDIMISVVIRREFLRDHLFSQFSKDSILSKFFINAINEKTNHDNFILFHSEKDRRIPLFFQELFSECYDPSINSNDILMHLFYLIMAELINVYENDLVKESEFSDKTSVASIIRYIEKNYKTCSLEEVSTFFHISPNYVSILLKKHLGMTYIQLIQDQKLHVAAYLLKNTNRPVTDIANEVGYENVSFFYKKFEQKYHCAPSEYRTK